jgi:micrococcal nuclease
MEPAYRYRARIVNVVDGDTVDAVIDVGFDITVTKRLRLLGIDTPERGQAGYQEAREALAAEVLNQEVTIVTEKSDSFGRYLASIHTGLINVNHWLVHKGLARIYRG